MDESQMTPITFAELECHGKVESLWIAVHGEVYDVTDFAVDHPGGVDVLQDCAGTDATETFESAGHGQEHCKKLANYALARLARAEAAAAPIDAGLASKPQQAVPATAQQNAKAALVARWGWAALFVVVAIAAWALARVLGGSVGYVPATPSPRHSFVGGFLLASMLSCSGVVLAYRKVSTTWDNDMDVFQHPALVPRRPVTYSMM